MIVVAWQDVPIGGSFVYIASDKTRYIIVTRIGPNEWKSVRPDTET